MKKIILFGGTSAIALACARVVVEKAEGEKPSFCIIGRNSERLTIAANDLKARGAKESHVLELQDWSDNGVQSCLENAQKKLSGYDSVWLFHAILGEADEHNKDWQKVRELFELNTMSYLRIMHSTANYFEQSGEGSIFVCSSVAADRGRIKNCWYAATKTPLDMVSEAMRQRFSNNPKIKLLTLKPGLIDTPLTANIKKGILCSTPEVVAETWYSWQKRGFEVVYAPIYWFIIMTIICLIPRPIFKKLKF